MQLVAASRMKKAQENAVKGKDYPQKIKELMVRLSGNKNVLGSPFIEPKYAQEVDGVLLIVFSPQRGLAGSLPGNLARYTFRLIDEIQKTEPVRVITVGRKVRDLLIRKGVNVIADFSDMPEQPTTSDIRPIYKLITEGYLAKEYGEVSLVYASFVNAITQIPVAKALLPLDLETVLRYEQGYSVNVEGSGDFVFEPNQAAILDELIPGYLESQIYQARLESVASEYSARMVSMKNATTNAKDVKSYLTLEYNKSRQAQITRELSEISAGRLARG
jgi:F-type H+-transporting ATPase subunit gamma